MHPANTTFGFVCSICSLVANTQMHQMLDVHGDESIEETVKKTTKKKQIQETHQSQICLSAQQKQQFHSTSLGS